MIKLSDTFQIDWGLDVYLNYLIHTNNTALHLNYFIIYESIYILYLAKITKRYNKNFLANKLVRNVLIIVV